MVCFGFIDDGTSIVTLCLRDSRLILLAYVAKEAHFLKLLGSRLEASQMRLLLKPFTFVLRLS